jgi:hypothetical protein
MKKLIRFHQKILNQTKLFYLQYRPKKDIDYKCDPITEKEQNVANLFADFLFSSKQKKEAPNIMKLLSISWEYDIQEIKNKQLEELKASGKIETQKELSFSIPNEYLESLKLNFDDNTGSIPTEFINVYFF